MPQVGEIKRGFELGKESNTPTNKTYRMAKYMWAACEVCGKERWVQLQGEKLRSKRCLSCIPKRGKASASWRGGRYKDNNGYIFVKVLPEDDFFLPMANKIRYVLEHRLVVAKALRRCLLPWETVHHKHGFAKDDNRYPETLELFPNPKKHDALTRMTTYIRKLEREIDILKRQNETY